MNSERIWVIDDDQSIRWVLERALKKAGMEVSSFESGDEVLNLLRTNALPPDAVISDVRMPGSDGLSFLSRFRLQHPGVPVLIMTAYSDLDTTVSAFEAGAFEYIPKPFDVEMVVQQTRKACGTLVETDNSQEKAADTDSGTSILIGESPAMQEVFNAIGRLARTPATVLVTGESGTGKELIAHALHRHSPRAARPFVAINMAAIPHDLMESELFGHEKGAFTGAQATRQGRFEQAEGGTLFLDEIGDMPAALQTRLLRVLSDGQYYRVGGHRPLKANVRIVAATHQDLERMVESRQFREDLFHRLNVIRIQAPPLRERREDIPLLMNHFLTNAAEELGVDAKQASDTFLQHIQTLKWPGNVRQLQNTAHWLTVMAPGSVVRIPDLPPDLHAVEDDVPQWEARFRAWIEARLASGEVDLSGPIKKRVEKIMLESALRKSGGHRQEAARLLGWGRNTLARKARELGLDD